MTDKTPERDSEGAHAPTEETIPTSDEAQLQRARSDAARQMGRSQSDKKGEAARLNGRKGGRPAGQKADEATRQRMKAAQQKRRDEEKDDLPNP